MANPQGFPLVNQQFVDGNGRITQAWRQFLVSLWQRTGSSAGSATFAPGDLKASGSDTAQDGWLVCDGTAVSRATYPGLFAAIGETWGPGDGFSTFNLPNLHGRALIGYDGAHPLGSTGGAAAVNLAVNQLPAHNHGITDPGHTHAFTADPHTHVVTDPGHIHTITDPGHHHTDLQAAATGGAAAGGAAAGGVTGDSPTGITINNHVTGVTNQNTNVTGTTDAHATGITTTNTGAGNPVPTQSPYAAVNYLIKT